MAEDASRFGTVHNLRVHGYRCTFTLTNSTVEFANALRRVIIAEVATLAIDIVTVQTNTSVLQDEMIVHRLGLLPIDSRKVEHMEERINCACDDACPRCSARFRLEVSSGDRPYTVTQQDVRPIAFSGGQDLEALPHCIAPRIFHEDGTEEELNIPIVKLGKNQSIKMEMTACKSIGKVHAKWSPVANSSFSFEPIVQINPQLQALTAEQKRKIEEICHKNVFQVGTQGAFAMGDEEEVLSVARPQDCVMCGDCETEVENIGQKGAIQVTYLPGVFHFTVESTGVMPATQVLMAAFDILVSKLNEVLSAAKHLTGVPQDPTTPGQAFGAGGYYEQGVAPPSGYDLS